MLAFKIFFWLLVGRPPEKVAKIEYLCVKIDLYAPATLFQVFYSVFIIF